MVAMAEYTIITKILDLKHLVILKDWLKFLHHPPSKIILYTPHNDLDEIEKTIALDQKGAIQLVSPLDSESLYENETSILKRLVQESETELFVSLNMDTLSFQEGHNNWFPEVAELILNDKILFFSGCGLLFRGDKPKDDGRHLATQRFSNNFAIMKKSRWLDIMARYNQNIVPVESARFHSEWAIEEACRQEKLFGLRRYDALDWRVFHVQQWDDRLFKTREKFLKGSNLNNFMNRYNEDYQHPWEVYYNYPKPSIIKRARIHIGKIRREVLGKST